jgi:hypothetical protein
MQFCGECGCNLSEVEAVTVTLNPNTKKEKLVKNFRNHAKNIGQKAQRGLSGASSMIMDKAFTVSERTNNVAVQKRVSAAMGNLVNLMINVSKDVTKQIPANMVNAIDLEAEVNFVAFTIGVTIDLAELKKGKDVEMVQLASSEEGSSPPPGPDINP